VTTTWLSTSLASVSIDSKSWSAWRSRRLFMRLMSTPSSAMRASDLRKRGPSVSSSAKGTDEMYDVMMVGFSLEA